MMQLARKAALVVVLLLLASVGTASAECACLPLRTFTPEERQQLETQYGVDWWKAMGSFPVRRPRATGWSAQLVRVPSPCSARSSSGILGLARATPSARAGRRASRSRR
jgi:hypothetical protein